MVTLSPESVVLERRILRPFDESWRTVANRAVFGADSVLCDGPNGALVLDGPFRRVLADPRSTWLADASLRTPSGRRIAAVEVELAPWSATDTELLIRPRARAPHLWNGRHLRRYFNAAHGAADALSAVLAAPRTTSRSLRPTPL